MRRTLRLLTAVAFAAPLGGCGGGAPPAGAAIPAAPALMAPLAKPAAKLEAAVFVPDLDTNVAIYPANIHHGGQQELGEITDGITRSEAAWVDRHQTLYILNSEESPSVEEYKPGNRTPFKRIFSKLYVPASVAVDKAGTVYVDDENSSGPVVYEYAHGSETPTSTVSLPPITNGAYFSLAVDPEGDLYAGGLDGKTGDASLVEIPAGSSEAKQVTLDNFPGAAIAIDGKGNLYSCSQSGFIVVYPPNSQYASYDASASGAKVFGGITVTGNGTLYVPSYSGEMFEFAPKATSPTNSFEIVPGAFDAAVGRF